MTDAEQINEQENRRPTAAEWPVIDILRSHHFTAGGGTSRPGDPGWSRCQCGVEMYWTDWQPHVARVIAAALPVLAGGKDESYQRWLAELRGEVNGRSEMQVELDEAREQLAAANKRADDAESIANSMDHFAEVAQRVENRNNELATQLAAAGRTIAAATRLREELIALIQTDVRWMRDQFDKPNGGVRLSQAVTVGQIQDLLDRTLADPGQWEADPHAECTWVCGVCDLGPEAHAEWGPSRECAYQPTLKHNHSARADRVADGGGSDA